MENGFSRNFVIFLKNDTNFASKIVENSGFLHYLSGYDYFSSNTKQDVFGFFKMTKLIIKYRLHCPSITISAVVPRNLKYFPCWFFVYISICFV